MTSSPSTPPTAQAFLWTLESIDDVRAREAYRLKLETKRGLGDRPNLAFSAAIRDVARGLKGDN